jgi:hypothetical protein
MAGSDRVNVFVLNTGRCGSVTFIRACSHISNYSAGHESRVTLGGAQRLAYPDNHIEADNRLSWLLGRLDATYGDRACYVHLSRQVEAAAASFARRADFGIMQAYREGILMGAQPQQSALDIARDYIATVEANIDLFLRDKSNILKFTLENAVNDFREFWDRIGAQGDYERALGEWSVSHNASAGQSYTRP